MKITSGQKEKMKNAIRFLRRRSDITRNILFKLGLFNVGIIFPLEYLLLREGIAIESFVDLGCGPHSFASIFPDEIDSMGVDIFDPYLEESKKRKVHKRYMKSDLRELELDEKTFDAVILLDVIEHLDKKDGKKLIQKATNWAKKKIVIYTPNDFFDQHSYDENPYQLHKSGWDVADMEELGFKVYGVKGAKRLEDHVAKNKGITKKILMALSKLSQCYTYFHPVHAKHLFCVKEI